MRKEPLLSICIPTYNREKYLKRLLDSIVSQKEFTDTDDVEIVVDDGPSTDNTESMVKEYISKYGNKIKYYRNPIKIGMCPAFLEALDLGTGKYLWLFGSDDFMSSESLYYALDALNDGPTTIIINGDELSDIYSKYTFNGLSDFLSYLGSTKLSYHLKDGFFTFMTECIIEKKYYTLSYKKLTLDGYSAQLLKDNYFNFNLIKYSNLYNNNRIVFIKSPCLSLSYDGSSTTWEMKFKIIHDLNLLIKYICNNYFVTNNTKKFFRKLLFTRYIGWIIVPFKKFLYFVKLNQFYVILSCKFKKLLNK